MLTKIWTTLIVVFMVFFSIATIAKAVDQNTSPVVLKYNFVIDFLPVDDQWLLDNAAKNNVIIEITQQEHKTIITFEGAIKDCCTSQAEIKKYIKETILPRANKTKV